MEVSVVPEAGAQSRLRPGEEGKRGLLESGWGRSRGGCVDFQLNNQENAISQARKDGAGQTRDCSNYIKGEKLLWCPCGDSQGSLALRIWDVNREAIKADFKVWRLNGVAQQVGIEEDSLKYKLHFYN